MGPLVGRLLCASPTGMDRKRATEIDTNEFLPKVMRFSSKIWASQDSTFCKSRTSNIGSSQKGSVKIEPLFWGGGGGCGFPLPSTHLVRHDITKSPTFLVLPTFLPAKPFSCRVLTGLSVPDLNFVTLNKNLVQCSPNSAMADPR